MTRAIASVCGASLLAACLALTASPARAQEPSGTSAPDITPTAPAEPAAPRSGRHLGPSALIAWTMGLPVGSTQDFVDDFSARGLRFDGRWSIIPQLAIGLSTGWTYFDDKRRGTFVADNGAFTSTQIRTLEAIPILATAHGALQLHGRVRVFAGLGIGTYYLQRQLDAYLFAVQDDGWHFGLAPEAGVLVDMRKFELWVGARYHWLAESDGFDARFMTFDLGVHTQ